MKKVKGKVLQYTAIFTKEPEGGYTAVVPSLQGCVTYGETFEKAQEMAKDAIEGYLYSLAKHGEQAPTEANPVLSTISVIPPKGLEFYA